MNIIYVGLYTKADIEAKITAIEAAINVVLSGGKSYRLNDTQGDIQVTRSSLKELEESRRYWEARWDELDEDRGQIISVRAVR